MTIPPIGPNQTPATPKDERSADDAHQRAKADEIEVSGTDTHQVSDTIELSRDAARIRDQQADITRLQVAERAADRFLEEQREFERLTQELQSPNDEIAEQARGALKTRAEEMEQNFQEAKFGNEMIFSRRVMNFSAAGKEEELTVPSALAKLREFIKELGNPAKRASLKDTRKLFEGLSVFRDKAKLISKWLEKDVRSSVERVVRQSANPRKNDLNEAEKAIRRARAAYPGRNSPGLDRISHKAVNLLK